MQLHLYTIISSFSPSFLNAFTTRLLTIFKNSSRFTTQVCNRLFIQLYCMCLEPELLPLIKRFQPPVHACRTHYPPTSDRPKLWRFSRMTSKPICLISLFLLSIFLVHYICFFVKGLTKILNFGYFVLIWWQTDKNPVKQSCKDPFIWTELPIV